MTGTCTPLPTPVKAPLDRRDYRLFTLPNQLKVALVHDPDTEQAGVSLDVAVGHLNDPPELLGLSHFVEHMCFLGTEKYPDEGIYEKYVVDHGGYVNATTSNESTNYYFCISAPSMSSLHQGKGGKDSHTGSASSLDQKEVEADESPLLKALDIFSQFFVAPLFTESATKRELDAVESEFVNGLQDDDRRNFQVAKVLLCENHPLHRFSCGNERSLRELPENAGINVRDACLAHHEKYYSSNLMSLSIVSSHSLDVVQEWVVSLFSAVVNKNVTRPSLEYEALPVLPEKASGRRLFSSTVCDDRVLNLSWETPYVREMYRSKPGNLCSSLLGHEAEGSLLSNLKVRGLVDSLDAFPRRPCAGHDFFDVSVSLTEKGVEFVDDVIQTVFGYIELCRENLPWWLHDEDRKMDEVNFRFSQGGAPLDWARLLTDCLQCQFLAPEDFLRESYILDDVDEDSVRSILGCLSPQNVNVWLLGKFVGEAAAKTEQWYGTPYGIEEISQEEIKRWEEASVAGDETLFMPKPNIYIPENLALLETPVPFGEQQDQPPKKLSTSGHMAVWHKLDRQFRQPTVVVEMGFESALIRSSTRNYTLAQLFTTLLEDELTEFEWKTRFAGMYYGVDVGLAGFSVYFSGYCDKIGLVIDRLLESMKGFIVDSTRFDDIFDERRRGLEDFLKSEACEVADSDATTMTLYPSLSDLDMRKCMADGSITAEAVNEFSRLVMRELKGTLFVHGNATEEWVIDLASKVERKLNFSPLAPAHVPNIRLVQIPTEFEVLLVRKCPNNEAESSATYIVFQIGQTGTEAVDIKRDVTAGFLVSLLQSPFFKELRTVQQLGYVVSVDEDVSGGVISIEFTIQGTKLPPEEICHRVEDFLAVYRSTILESLTEEDLKPHIDSLVSHLQEPDRTSEERADRLWGEISGEYFCFDRDRRAVEAARSISCHDVVELFDQCIARTAKKRRRLTSIVYGNVHTMGKDRDIVNAVSAASGGRKVRLVPLGSKVEFQNAMTLWPSPGGVCPYTVCKD